MRKEQPGGIEIVLHSNIKLAAMMHTNVFRDGYMCLLKGEFPYETQKEADRIYKRIVREYYNAVARYVLDNICRNSPEQYKSIQQNLMYPARCGYPKIKPESLDGAALFAVCFHGITGEKASPHYCKSLTKYYADIINDIKKECLAKLDK